METLQKRYSNVGFLLKQEMCKCSSLDVMTLPSSDAEHRRRPPASRRAGAEVHLLLQLVHRALLSPAQSLPPRLRQTVADGVWYDSTRPLT